MIKYETTFTIINRESLHNNDLVNMIVLSFPQVVIDDPYEISSLNLGPKSHNKSSEALTLPGLLPDMLGPPERRARGDVLQSGLLAQVS